MGINVSTFSTFTIFPICIMFIPLSFIALTIKYVYFWKCSLILACQLYIILTSLFYNYHRGLHLNLWLLKVWYKWALFCFLDNTRSLFPFVLVVLYFNLTHILDCKRNYCCFLHLHLLRFIHMFTLPIVFCFFMHVLAFSWDHFMLDVLSRNSFSSCLSANIFILLLNKGNWKWLYNL